MKALEETNTTAPDILIMQARFLMDNETELEFWDVYL